MTNVEKLQSGLIQSSSIDQRNCKYLISEPDVALKLLETFLVKVTIHISCKFNLNICFFLLLVVN